jgi:hypothetical protein
MDNAPRYGFRWSKAANGGVDHPKPIWMSVASAASFDVSSGAANVRLRPGDPVVRASTGGVTLVNGVEDSQTAIAPYAIVVAVGPYWDGTKMVFGNSLPSDTTWGTVQERRSMVGVVPVDAGVWEIDCDDASTATTEAAYLAFIGENANFQLTGTTGQSYAYPKLDISSHATTGSLVWRIVGISGTQDNRDFSGANVKLLVQPNLAQLPNFASVAAATANNTTGV